MDKYELKAIIQAHRRDALGYNDSELANERAEALDRYYGRPYGNELEGWSQVVSKDIAETIDWALPGILKMFVQSGNIAEFTPVGPEDEELAEQESDYVNHVIMNDNNGFYVLHDTFKDALLLKNGYFKHFWDEKEIVKELEYDNLSEDQLILMLQELDAVGEVKVKEQEEVIQEIEGLPVVLYHVKLQVKYTEGKVCIEPVPPEEIRVSKRARAGTQDAPFIEHVTKRTRSELIEMGMDADFVYGLPAWSDQDNTDDQTYSRDTVSDESDDSEGMSFDRSMDEVEYCEAYIRIDYDGDKVAELRKIVLVGNQIPDGDDWNEPIDSIPLTVITPKRVPHRHIGESMHDELAEIQEIKTVLTRQLLDNVYNTNHNQTVVNERAYLPDFLQAQPGGVKRIMGEEPVQGSYAAINIPPIIDKILPAIDYVDSVKHNRTGINEVTTGLDPDVLKESTKGAYLDNVNRASQKVEMIARLFAEGVKEMVLRVHELLMKHQDRAKVIKLRGKYVEVNPQEWKERTDLKVKVGIGTGSEEEKREKLMLISQLQDKLMPMGLVAPNNAYSLFSDLSKSLGFEMPEKYALDPQSQEYQMMMAQSQQQQPNPLAEVEAIKGQFMMQREQMQGELKATMEQIKQTTEHQHKMHELEARILIEDANRTSREAIETAKLEMQAFIEGLQADLGKPGIGAGLQDEH
jgi:hypothetical protein